MRIDLPGCGLGVATAATQIEGGAHNHNWADWARRGRILDGSSPVRATDHWNRVADDTELLSDLGIKHYRMGLEWSRIEPTPGSFDEAAFAHYRFELMLLREAGIDPMLTLHHFNNPSWLEERGGFLNPGAIRFFLRFVSRVVRALGDLVDEYVTINEPNVYATYAYQYGLWPPGHQSARDVVAVSQNLAVAHIRAYQLIHSLQPAARVGTAMHVRIFRPANRANPYHVASARALDYAFQGCMLRAVSRGQFRPPLTQPGDIRPGIYYDFQGVNYYSRSTVTGPADGTGTDVPINDLGWEIYPQGIVEVAARVNRRFPGPIYITENGTADAADAFRSRFIYDHLAAISRSALPIRRYYHWCLVDNWEWIEGEQARFGLIENDFETQTRTVRPSGRFYADVIANAGVTDEAYERYVAHEAYPTTRPEHVRELTKRSAEVTA